MDPYESDASIQDIFAWIEEQQLFEAENEEE